ncbi:MAG TPA: NAD+ synthase [Bacteroidales bacterium]|nr:NAD+ synthase [Bacteroidales bacterium]
MKIALAQCNFVAGDLQHNKQLIIKTIHEAQSQNADLVVFSELSICGYPVYDLLEQDHFVKQCIASVNEIAQHCDKIGAIVGSPWINTNEKGKRLYNAALLLHDKKIQAVYRKGLLPTYDVFDEYRYFEPADNFSTIIFKGKKLAITICEDIWTIETPMLYTNNPLDVMVLENPDCIINLSASPFCWSHPMDRTNTFSAISKKYGLPLLVANQVGGHGELIFDGQSMAINAEGNIVSVAELFTECILYADIHGLNSELKSGNDLHHTEYDKNSLIEKALISGIKEFFQKQGFTKAVVGLSGGLDSALVLVLAARALGAENCLAVLLPGPYSTDHSVSDALQLVENIKVPHTKISINHIFDSLCETMVPLFGNLPSDITEENYQARIRGMVLMGISNKLGYILLNSSNKSESAVGYGTLYGDMCGSLSVIGDLYKTEAYNLAEYINRDDEIIPRNIIQKPPSAELRPDQRDTDSLPPYDILDSILFHLIENRQSVPQIVQMGYELALVERVQKMLLSSEFKRRQAPPTIRISKKSFGFGRKMPLVARLK